MAGGVLKREVTQPPNGYDINQEKERKKHVFPGNTRVAQ